MSERFTPKAQYALNTALSLASDMGHSYIGSEHILLGLMETPECAASKILSSRGLDKVKIKNTVIEITGTASPAPVSPSDMTPRTKKIIEASAQESLKSGHSYIGTEHILLSLLSEKDCVAVRIIESFGCSPKDIRSDIEGYLSVGPTSRKNAVSKGDAEENAKGDTKRSYIANHGRDLTELAGKGKIDPIIGRDGETARVIQILSRRSKNNPCLIGEPGVGKTAVVEGLAQMIADGNVPETLRDKRVITLDISSMIAGAKYRGEFEERLKGVLREARKNPDIIIFIDEIHTIIGAGAAEGAVDAANIIKPALARGELQVIGATTISEYRRYIEKDAALERRFQSVNVGEPSRDEAIRILFGLRSKYEAHHRLSISNEAIEAAVDMSIRYIPDRFLPDKAIDLIDEAASKLRICVFTSPPDIKQMEEELEALELEKSEAITEQNFEAAAELRDRERALREKYSRAKNLWKSEKNSEMLTLSREHIAEIVTQWTSIPVSRIIDGDRESLTSLEERIKARVIGQDMAVEAVSKAVRRGRMGLKDPDRPIGSFIFAGPTGVGKTELSRALADILFGGEDAMIRIDMSEYMEKQSVSKLIGSPPGYVGYGEGGQLTEKIRRRPYSIVLFDEIEKAHPDVFNILLQLLDDGMLTDSQGRRVDFKNAIVIMTTNIGVKGGGTARLGFSAHRSATDEADIERDGIREQLKNSFRPEFINRVDEIIIFNRLTSAELEKIVINMLSTLIRRVRSNGIELRFSADVPRTVAEFSYEERYGARQLRRSVTRLIEDPLSEALLDGRFVEGDKILSYVSNGKILFRKEK